MLWVKLRYFCTVSLVESYSKAKSLLHITTHVEAAVDTKVNKTLKPVLFFGSKKIIISYWLFYYMYDWYKQRAETKMEKPKKCLLYDTSNTDESRTEISARNLSDMSCSC